MIRFGLYIFALHFFLSTAWAEPSAVRSGDHEGFTRLVVALNGTREWSVNQAAESVTLSLPGFKDGFDISDIYRRITSERVAEVSATSDTLTIALGCDCTASAFLERDAFVVLDFASPGVELATPLISPEPEAIASADFKTGKHPIPVLPRSVLSRPTRNPHQLPRTPLNSEAKQVLTDVRQQLAEELGTAATSGILTPRKDLPKPARATPTVMEPRPQPELRPETLPHNPLANLRISSSRDVPENSYNGHLRMSATGLKCPPNGQFDATLWGDRRPFQVQIAEARQGLFTELGRLDPEVALRLARKFLYFGFGAEARQVLHMDPVLITEHNHLVEIARIFDDVPSNRSPDIADYATCKTDIALWAILALPESVPPPEPSVAAALQDLNGLPIHLRLIIAPKLSHKFLTLNDPEAAATALRTIKRLPEELPPAGQLAKAEGALRAGDTTIGKETLEQIVATNTAESPKALIALVDAQLEAGQPVSAETASLVAAYAKELRDTADGPELRRTHVIALLKSGQFDAAFAASAELGGNSNTQAASALRQSMLRELIISAGDIDFLHHIFAQSDGDIAQLPLTDLTRLAERFLALGFALRAENVLALLPENKRNDMARRLAARISLAVSKPFKAKADLLGVEGEDADLLRAEANRMAGAHEDAYRLFAKMKRAEDAVETAWLAENWRALTPTDAPVFGAAVTLELPEEPAAAGRDGMLTRTEELLTESARTRETLAELLQSERLRIAGTE